MLLKHVFYYIQITWKHKTLNNTYYKIHQCSVRYILYVFRAATYGQNVCMSFWQER